MNMADVTRQTITVANAAKLLVFLMGLSGLYYGLKSDQQALRDEIKLMISDYKGEDRLINLRIENNDRHDDKQDEALKLLVDKTEAIIPEGPRIRRSR